MEELIVEGLEAGDFIVLERIIKSYKVSLDDEISFQDIKNLHAKVKQIVDYLQE
jgi:hypothetical protein